MSRLENATTSGHCDYCGGRLSGLGFNFVCHACGAEYCYVHMGRHEIHRASESQAIVPS